MHMENQVYEDRWGFKRFVQSSVSEGFLRPPVIMQGMSGPNITRDGQPFVNFSGINYLGWQQDPAVLQAFCASVMRYGLSTGGSRATQGVCEPHHRLERILSEHHGKDKTLTFASGMLANMAWILARIDMLASALAMAAIAGIAEGLVLSLSLLRLYTRVPTMFCARMVALLDTATAASFLLAVLATGAVADHMPANVLLEYMAGIFACLLLLGAAVTAIGTRRHASRLSGTQEADDA